MAAAGPINPKLFVNSLVGKRIIVKLKCGHAFKGYVKAVDRYMNLQIANAKQYNNEACTGN